MKQTSIFDVIGPNMIGPSSSHTAGALRIAQIAAGIANGRVIDVTFTLYGSFASTYKGHGTDKAALAGILGFGTEDERIRDAYRYADERGLKYRFVTDFKTQADHPNTIKIEMRSENGGIDAVTGSSVGGGAISIDNIDGMDVQFSGELNTILVKHRDTPGIVAFVSHCLAQWEVNIAYMRLYRESKGNTALLVAETDQYADDSSLSLIAAHKDIQKVKILPINK